jgi:hypothetical protein
MTLHRTLSLAIAITGVIALTGCVSSEYKAAAKGLEAIYERVEPIMKRRDDAMRDADLWSAKAQESMNKHRTSNARREFHDLALKGEFGGSEAIRAAKAEMEGRAPQRTSDSREPDDALDRLKAARKLEHSLNLEIGFLADEIEKTVASYRIAYEKEFMSGEKVDTKGTLADKAKRLEREVMRQRSLGPVTKR